MPRHLNLRQIEAFKAVMENGTLHRAADLLNISQPAMSKLIANLEFDTGLKLFDRLKRRLVPTDHATQLYSEVERIFAGVRQVENAVEVIRRAEQGRLVVGFMAAAGPFVQRATTNFLRDHDNVFCSVHSLTSQWVVNWLVERKLDVGLVSAGTENPYVTRETLMEHPLVCIMHKEHALAAKSNLEPKDLDGVPFVSFAPDTYIGHRVSAVMDSYGVSARTVLVANVAPRLCEFVASGIGVSLVHPLMVSGLEHRLAVRRFEPDILYNFQLCRGADSRNARIVDAFAEELRTTAKQISISLLGEG